MKLFRLRRKPESGQEEKELVLDTDAEPQAIVPDRTEAEAETPTPDAGAEAATPQGDLLVRISAEADSETEAEGSSPQEEDSLDPELLEIFRDAKNEVLESTLASELEDVPIQELLSDLVSVSRRLRITPPPRVEPGQDGK